MTRPLPRLRARFKAMFWVLGVVGAVDVFQAQPSGRLSADALLPVLAMARDAPAALPSDDEDRDGIPDSLEMELARRYAPIVILDRRDESRPSSLPWLLAREPPALVAAAGVAAVVSPPPARFTAETRRGSDDPEDWTTYVHVYPRVDGGMNLQYWFFYPYNDGPWLFKHEGDWEHITVRLDGGGSPLGAYLARHEDNNPGSYHPWRSLRTEGDRPVVLSARGTHATYADERNLPWFEEAGRCEDLDGCRDPVWRTWEGGGLVNIGERTAPLGPGALGFEGRWGAAGALPGTSAPRGPLFHPGFCHAGFSICGGPVLAASPASSPADL